MAFTPGIDVSLYQKQIDWGQAVAGGIRFVFMKCSQGVTVTDPMFATNWSGAKAAGLLVGVYHFVNPTLAAQDQINHLLQVLGDRKPDFPIALDVEKPVDSDPPDVTQVVSDFVTKLTQQTGRKPLLYTAPAYWNSHVNGGLHWPDYDLWIANYGPSTPTLPHAWTSWKFWQYSGNGTAAGVTTPVDLDWFNGSADDLTAYAHSSGGSTAQAAPAAAAQPAVSPAPAASTQPSTGTTVMYIVTKDGLHVRDNPSTTANILTSLPYNTPVHVTSETSGIFVKVLSPAIGWIAKGDGSEVYLSTTPAQS